MGTEPATVWIQIEAVRGTGLTITSRSPIPRSYGYQKDTGGERISERAPRRPEKIQLLSLCLLSDQDCLQRPRHVSRTRACSSLQHLGLDQAPD